jgi:hypothetical protein
MSLPGLTGQSSTHGRWLLDRPAKPGDDSEMDHGEQKRPAMRSPGDRVILFE